jgi:hypothetical protein
MQDAAHTNSGGDSSSGGGVAPGAPSAVDAQPAGAMAVPAVASTDGGGGGAGADVSRKRKMGPEAALQEPLPPAE